jgi:hypothetical protein
MDAEEILARVLDRVCLKCGAAAGTDCHAPELAWAPTRFNRQHATRHRIGPAEPIVLSETDEKAVQVACTAPVPPMAGLLDAAGGTGAVGFDIETASADELYTGRHEGPFVRLTGWIGEDGVPHTSADPADLLAALDGADIVYGHNIFRFDLIALAVHCGADYDALCARSVDTLHQEVLLTPPAAKGGTKPEAYDLDAVARRYGHDGKSDDLKALAARHGGFDRIPVDDPEYIAYLCGDLLASKHVYDAQATALKELTR